MADGKLKEFLQSKTAFGRVNQLNTLLTQISALPKPETEEDELKLRGLRADVTRKEYLAKHPTQQKAPSSFGILGQKFNIDPITGEYSLSATTSNNLATQERLINAEEPTGVKIEVLDDKGEPVLDAKGKILYDDEMAPKFSQSVRENARLERERILVANATKDVLNSGAVQDPYEATNLVLRTSRYADIVVDMIQTGKGVDETIIGSIDALNKNNPDYDRQGAIIDYIMSVGANDYIVDNAESNGLSLEETFEMIDFIMGGSYGNYNINEAVRMKY